MNVLISFANSSLKFNSCKLFILCCKQLQAPGKYDLYYECYALVAGRSQWPFVRYVDMSLSCVQRSTGLAPVAFIHSAQDLKVCFVCFSF